MYNKTKTNEITYKFMATIEVLQEDGSGCYMEVVDIYDSIKDVFSDFLQYKSKGQKPRYIKIKGPGYYIEISKSLDLCSVNIDLEKLITNEVKCEVLDQFIRLMDDNAAVIEL